MLRLRIPNGVIDAYKLRAVAAIADELGGGYAHVTTRANLQIREIGPQHALRALERVAEAGLTSRGAGADNIRNITGNPTAGIDAQELYDTRPLGLALYHAILNHRELYGLPRKFNIAFDGGGSVASLEDTNDIGLSCVNVGEGRIIAPGAYFRVAVGGITGHGHFASDLGVVVTPEQCVPVAVALVRLPLTECEPRPRIARGAHVGFHAQKQAERVYCGIALPVGRLGVAQMRGVADIAERFGSGSIRLTVWQNLIVSDIAESDCNAVESALAEIGLSVRASAIGAGVVACTGNTGCKFSASDTKRHAAAIVAYLDARVALDTPLNIHLTGCPNSCAQHAIGDIGLLATKINAGDSESEGYHLFVGGGFGERRELAREAVKAVPADEAPRVIERLLRSYLEHRVSPDESFRAFAKRQTPEALRALAEASLPEAV
jgi:ferredoxin-nitrite reductase